MCLNYPVNQTSFRFSPYNKARIRYKVVVRLVSGAVVPAFMPFADREVEYDTNGINYAKRMNNWCKWRDAGFHVFVDLESARALYENFTSYGSGSVAYHLVEVFVDGFIRAGSFHDGRSETWDRLVVIRTLDCGGGPFILNPNLGKYLNLTKSPLSRWNRVKRYGLRLLRAALNHHEGIKF